MGKNPLPVLPVRKRFATATAITDGNPEIARKVFAEAGVSIGENNINN